MPASIALLQPNDHTPFGDCPGQFPMPVNNYYNVYVHVVDANGLMLYVQLQLSHSCVPCVFVCVCVALLVNYFPSRVAGRQVTTQSTTYLLFYSHSIYLSVAFSRLLVMYLAC